MELWLMFVFEKTNRENICESFNDYIFDSFKRKHIICDDFSKKIAAKLFKLAAK